MRKIRDDTLLMLTTVALSCALCATIFGIGPCSRDKKPKEQDPIIYPKNPTSQPTTKPNRCPQNPIKKQLHQPNPRASYTSTPYTPATR